MENSLDVFVRLLWASWGLPYIWGGDDPIKGFDCSGLVIEAYQSIGFLPHGSDYTSQGLHDLMLKRGGKLIKTPEKGALIFCGESIKKITHIMPAINSKLVIEAGGGGSSSTDAEKASKMNAYVKCRPWNRRTDIVAIVMPDYSTLGW